jgi:hypothetical protein
MAETDADVPYLSPLAWSNERPDALVVCCSDGRFKQVIDQFLHDCFGIDRYDRLYAPGGPGALATSGWEYSRADIFRRECAFLVKAHQTKKIILLFHGATSDGPEYAVCAHYRRLFPRLTPAEISVQQENDLREVIRLIAYDSPHIELHAVRAEVRSDEQVQFVPLPIDLP